MAKKGNMSAMLKSSVAHASDAAARVHTPVNDVTDRFAKADAIMVDQTTLANRPQGSATPSTVPKAGSEGSLSDVMLDIVLIDDNPYNARQIYNPQIVADRAASLASDKGQMESIKVATHPEKPGRYVLIDGHYRKRGAQRIGWRQLRCTVRQVDTMLDLYRLSFALNDEHASQTVLDNALAWRKLLDDKVVSELADIESITAVKVPKISKTLAILDLPREVLDKLCERPDKIGLEIAYELTLYCKQFGNERTLVLATRILDEDLSSRDIAAMRKRPHLHASRERSRQYKLNDGAGDPIGVVKDFDDGRLELKVRILDPERRAALIDQLKRQLETA